jgi:ABC-2 type transport system ATP-binding protein
VIDHGALIAEGSSDELKAKVGGERLELKLEDPSQCDAAITALTDLASEAPTREDGMVRVPLHRRHGAIAEAVRRLDRAEIAIDDIAVRRPTLDDAFLSLTGRPPEPEDGEGEQDTGEHQAAAGEQR